jgi:uncharacterized protein
LQGGGAAVVVRAVSYTNDQVGVTPARRVLMRSPMWVRAHWHEGRELPLLHRVSLFHPDLPEAFDGLRIIQVADVHAGNFMPTERLARVRGLIEGAEPDLLVFTGDQLDRRDIDADVFVQGFAGVGARLGAYGILGNHDHKAGPSLAIAALDAVGVVPLINTAALLERNGTRLAVIGVDDLDAGPGWGPDYSVIQQVPAHFRLLLCHQPNGWRAGRLAGAEITLSGHTHGGQITVSSQGLNTARLTTRYVAGPYKKAGALLYVSRGIGVGAVPLRVGSLPELDLITLWKGPLGAL